MVRIIIGDKKIYPKNVCNKVCRNFQVGDRVKLYFKKKWYPGTIANKYSKENKPSPYILVKTDYKVDDEPDALLDGFGLEGRIDQQLDKIFEWEKVLGDDIYHEEITWEMSEEEKRKYDNPPF